MNKLLMLLAFVLISSAPLLAMQIGVLMGLPIYATEEDPTYPFIVVDEDDEEFDEVVYRARQNRIGIRIKRRPHRTHGTGQR